jgi:hypothetical protein
VLHPNGLRIKRAKQTNKKSQTTTKDPNGLKKIWRKQIEKREKKKQT